MPSLKLQLLDVGVSVGRYLVGEVLNGFSADVCSNDIGIIPYTEEYYTYLAFEKAHSESITAFSSAKLCLNSVC